MPRVMEKSNAINGGNAAVFQNIQGNGRKLILKNPANVVNLTGHQIEAVVKRLKESRSVGSWIEQGNNGENFCSFVHCV